MELSSLKNKKFQERISDLKKLKNKTKKLTKCLVFQEIELSSPKPKKLLYFKREL